MLVIIATSACVIYRKSVGATIGVGSKLSSKVGFVQGFICIRTTPFFLIEKGDLHCPLCSLCSASIVTIQSGPHPEGHLAAPALVSVHMLFQVGSLRSVIGFLHLLVFGAQGG